MSTITDRVRSTSSLKTSYPSINLSNTHRLNVVVQDYLLVLWIVIAFLIASSIQMFFILGLAFSIKLFVMPLVMAVVFSWSMIRLRVVKRRLIHERDQRDFANTKVQLLNNRLSELLAQRTELLSAAQDQVTLAQTRADLGAMSAGVIHDINNTLMAALMSWEILTSGGLNAQERVEFEESLSTSLEQALKITNEFGKLLRPHEGDVTDICAAVRTLFSFLSRSMESKQTLQLIWGAISSPLDLSPTWSPARGELEPPPKVKLDAQISEAQLTQVLLNLVVNARDALHKRDGGDVVIEVYSNVNEIILQVSDNGVGMSLELQHKIFDPFFTTKPEGEGTGLGLHVLDHIIKRIGGQITLTSQEGVGSTFTVSLPHAL